MTRRLVLAALLVLTLAPGASGSASDLQARLAKQSDFLARVENRIVAFAIVVKGEGTGVTNHAARAAYADQVLVNSAAKAIQWAQYLAGSTNVIGTLTNLDDGRVATTVTDAALDSQISTGWNLFAVAG
jgi:hypothetical protein